MPTPDMGLQLALSPHWLSPARRAFHSVDGEQMRAQNLEPLAESWSADGGASTSDAWLVAVWAYLDYKLLASFACDHQRCLRRRGRYRRVRTIWARRCRCARAPKRGSGGCGSGSASSSAGPFGFGYQWGRRAGGGVRGPRLGPFAFPGRIKRQASKRANAGKSACGCTVQCRSAVRCGFMVVEGGHVHARALNVKRSFFAKLVKFTLAPTQHGRVGDPEEKHGRDG